MLIQVLKKADLLNLYTTIGRVCERNRDWNSAAANYFMAGNAVELNRLVTALKPRAARSPGIRDGLPRFEEMLNELRERIASRRGLH